MESSPGLDVDAPAVREVPAADKWALEVDPVPIGETPFPSIIGRSEPIRRVFSLIEKAANSDATVLVLGETGTGKELVARTIHDAGPRAANPFVAVNCGAIAEHLQESELFGYKKGAFTGAVGDSEGLFEAANGGTIFLDEIAETTTATQVKLLRVLQEGEVRRVGETRTRPVDVRLIAATNRDLEAEVASERFRQDLYYRIVVLVMHLPPLRKRRDDIPLLVQYFCGKAEAELDDSALALLRSYEWPGNIRELENQLSSARVLAAPEPIGTRHLWPRLREKAAATDEVDLGAFDKLTLRDGREQFERAFIAARLLQLQWDQGASAKSLGISRSRLYDLIRKYGLTEAEGR